MTPWQWWYGDGIGPYVSPRDTKDEAIRAGIEFFAGEPFDIVEARQSTSQLYEHEDEAPFLRERNHEKIDPTLKMIS